MIRKLALSHRLRALAFVLCFIPFLVTQQAHAQSQLIELGVCNAMCDFAPVFTTAKEASSTALGTAVTIAGAAIYLKIELVEMHITRALRGHSYAFQNSMTMLASYIGKFLDSELGITSDLRKKMNNYQIANNLGPVGTESGGDRPTTLECQHLSSLGGIQSQFSRRMVENHLNQNARLSFENDSTTLFAYGTAASQRKLFDQWRRNWCVDSANNGLVPEGCGEDRDADNYTMQNLDLKISDIMFNPATWPSEDMNAAEKNLIYYFSVRPMNPFNATDLNNTIVQTAFMQRRSLQARKAMADAAFYHLMSKRVPIMTTGRWMREVLDLNINDDVTGESLSAIIDDMPDEVSYSQWAETMNSRRFLGTDYFARIQQLDEGPAETELNKLMAMRLVQLRERYHIMERMLGVLASDYAQDLDDRSMLNTIAHNE